MNPRVRVTAALVGLLVLVFVGWLVTDAASPEPEPAPAPTSSTRGESAPASTEDRTLGPRDGGADTTPVALSALPPEAARTYALIESDGPYPHPQDGRAFGNREGLLPPRPDGYYREFTVATPGEGDRGARRLVAGRDGDVWWTADHYESFTPVDPAR